MRKFPVALVAALALTGSLAAPALSADHKVRIWTPSEAPDVPSRIDGEDVSRPHIVNVNVRVAVAVLYPDYRRIALRRAFGHRYLGFIKQYSGPRYPF